MKYIDSKMWRQSVDCRPDGHLRQAEWPTGLRPSLPRGHAVEAVRRRWPHQSGRRGHLNSTRPLEEASPSIASPSLPPLAALAKPLLSIADAASLDTTARRGTTVSKLSPTAPPCTPLPRPPHRGAVKSR